MGGWGEPDLLAVLGDGGPQGMLAAVLRRADHGQQPGAGHAVGLHHDLQLHHLGGAVRDGARLVEHHRLDLTPPAERRRLKGGYHATRCEWGQTLEAVHWMDQSTSRPVDCSQ